MGRKPLLSIILVVHNQRDIIEPTFEAIFEIKAFPFELIVIDDGSTDGSTDTIQSLLDFHGHEQTFYFEHERPAGRANSLNEALLQCNGQFIWAPTSIEQINVPAFGENLELLDASSAVGLIQTDTLPGSLEEWLKLLAEDHWPVDGAFIWKKNQIPDTQQFFNPFLASYHAIELLLRLSHNHNVVVKEAFSTSSGFDQHPEPTPVVRAEMLYTLLRSQPLSEEQRNIIYKKLQELLNQGAGKARDLYKEALQLREAGRLSEALELTEAYLKAHPSHYDARRLAIEILEKKRRYVEASELKKGNTSEKAGDSSSIRTSVIIPTAIYGKRMLEHCLINLFKHCNPETTELIVIDNASLDDTHDYLEELKEKAFLHCKIITNAQNKGFAASVNQGLDEASGTYACILHNDVEIKNDTLLQLEALMDANPEYAIIAPLTEKTLNPDQSLRFQEDYDKALVQAEYLDSFCMMIRTSANLRMDETFELAFFEDIDLCFQARKKGYKVGIASELSVIHHYGQTTFALNLDTESEQYWKNVAYFNDKWKVEVHSEEELKSKSTFDQLLALDEWINPLFPEEKLKDYFEELFTDELKTEMMRSRHDEETLCKLVHLMMVMNERELMRRLEDRLDAIELPASLIYQLVRFYFERNIYSRCTHYLNKLKAEQRSLQSELYKLEILVNNKEMEQAVPKLNELLNDAPANPSLYRLAADIHRIEGNEEEAESFYTIARQINPFQFKDEDEKAGLQIKDEDLL